MSMSTVPMARVARQTTYYDDVNDLHMKTITTTSLSNRHHKPLFKTYIYHTCRSFIITWFINRLCLLKSKFKWPTLHVVTSMAISWPGIVCLCWGRSHLDLSPMPSGTSAIQTPWCPLPQLDLADHKKGRVARALSVLGTPVGSGL